jgi:hypothetical protein
MDSRRYNFRGRKITSGRTAEGESISIDRDRSKGQKGAVKDKVTGDETRIAEVRGTGKRKVVEIDGARTDTSPNEKEFKKSRTPEKGLPTPRSETPQVRDASTSTPILPQIASFPLPPDIPSLPHGHSLSDKSTLVGRSVLDTPFEYTPPEKPKTTTTEVPEVLEIEPKFARVLEYVALDNEGPRTMLPLNILAGIASPTISEQSLPSADRAQERTCPPTDLETEPESTITAHAVGPSQSLDMQEIVPGLFLGSYIPL